MYRCYFAIKVLLHLHNRIASFKYTWHYLADNTKKLVLSVCSMWKILCIYRFLTGMWCDRHESLSDAGLPALGKVGPNSTVSRWKSNSCSILLSIERVFSHIIIHIGCSQLKTMHHIYSITNAQCYFSLTAPSSDFSGLLPNLWNTFGNSNSLQCCIIPCLF